MSRRLPAVSAQFGEVKTSIGSIAISVILFILMAINQSIFVAFILYFFIGIVLSSWPLVVTLAQKNMDIQLQGKAEGLFNGLGGVMVFFIYLNIYFAENYSDLPANNWFYLMAFLSIISILPLYIGSKLQKHYKKMQKKCK